MGRSFEKHLDSQELAALVPWPPDSGQDPHGPSPDAIRVAERHVESCADCQAKVSKYRQLVGASANVAVSRTVPASADCPKDEDVDWVEVAADRWPELKALQLISHAALCTHCGPLLRAATSAADDATPQEEKLMAELKVPSRPVTNAQAQLSSTDAAPPSIWQRLLQWHVWVPATALILIITLFGVLPWSSSKPLSGKEYTRFAVDTHKQRAQGSLALDIQSDSQQTLNEWLKANSKFSLALPASPVVPGEERPYRLEGARLLPVGGKTAAYIAYRMQTGPVGLVVTPDSVAVASGGVEASFKKVTFHYGMVEGYKVVTWSLHGLTYALVSQEGNSTQQSCMVCHSAMRDRDLSHTPTPLPDEVTALDPVWPRHFQD